MLRQFEADLTSCGCFIRYYLFIYMCYPITNATLPLQREEHTKDRLQKACTAQQHFLFLSEPKTTEIENQPLAAK